MSAFLIIGIVGLVLLVATFLIGEFLDGVFDGIGGDWFSGAALGGFLAAFGFVGELTSRSLGVGAGVGLGLLAGVVVGGIAAWLTRTLQRTPDHSTVSTGGLVGRTCSVSTPIPEGGLGEVTLVASGHITRLNARSVEPIAAGTTVTITAVLSATAVQVEPAPR